MVKDIEAMDASILKGEQASGKKQKVSSLFRCLQEGLCRRISVTSVEVEENEFFLQTYIDIDSMVLILCV